MIKSILTIDASRPRDGSLKALDMTHGLRPGQNIRKDAGFSVEDRINISWELDSEFEDAISKFREYFCNETLTVSFSEVSNKNGYETDFNLRNRKIKLSIYKANG